LSNGFCIDGPRVRFTSDRCSDAFLRDIRTLCLQTAASEAVP
jgi:hypothetical protein